jgi:hypothetical protein
MLESDDGRLESAPSRAPRRSPAAGARRVAPTFSGAGWAATWLPHPPRPLLRQALVDDTHPASHADRADGAAQHQPGYAPVSAACGSGVVGGGEGASVRGCRRPRARRLDSAKVQHLPFRVHPGTRAVSRLGVASQPALHLLAAAHGGRRGEDSQLAAALARPRPRRAPLLPPAGRGARRRLRRPRPCAPADPDPTAAPPWPALSPAPAPPHDPSSVRARSHPPLLSLPLSPPPRVQQQRCTLRAARVPLIFAPRPRLSSVPATPLPHVFRTCAPARSRLLRACASAVCDVPICGALLHPAGPNLPIHALCCGLFAPFTSASRRLSPERL